MEGNLEQITVYTARVVRTMEPALPLADAVAIRGDRIVEVGDRHAAAFLDETPRRRRADA